MIGLRFPARGAVLDISVRTISITFPIVPQPIVNDSLQLSSMLSTLSDYELWQLVCRPTFCCPSAHFSLQCCTDTGREKRELCLQLGAEKWVDFRETKDLVKDIKDAAGGEGPHAALVSAASVSSFSKPLGRLIATHTTRCIEHWI